MRYSKSSPEACDIQVPLEALKVQPGRLEILKFQPGRLEILKFQPTFGEP